MNWACAVRGKDVAAGRKSSAAAGKQGRSSPVALDDIAGFPAARRVRVGKRVVLMDLSRQQFVAMLRHAGLNDIADAAEAELPSQGASP